MSNWLSKRHKSRSKKVLTVTYYVEPRNLRMFTIPVGRLSTIIGLVGVSQTWRWVLQWSPGALMRMMKNTRAGIGRLTPETGTASPPPQS